MLESLRRQAPIKLLRDKNHADCMGSGNGHTSCKAKDKLKVSFSIIILLAEISSLSLLPKIPRFLILFLFIVGLALRALTLKLCALCQKNRNLGNFM